ncbi:MAG: integron [Pseudomonadota bacterium]
MARILKGSNLRAALAASVFACLAGIAALHVPAFAQRPQTPVMVGGDADYDACGSQGVVKGLKASGDGFLAVRAGPGSNNAMLDKVYNGYILSLCDERGGWYGVVYSHESRDCGVSTPWPRRQPYSGPCRSGWVYKKYVGAYAG